MVSSYIQHHLLINNLFLNVNESVIMSNGNTDSFNLTMLNISIYGMLKCVITVYCVNPI